jgi:hypothetical protein
VGFTDRVVFHFFRRAEVGTAVGLVLAGFVFWFMIVVPGEFDLPLEIPPLVTRCLGLVGLPLVVYSIGRVVLDNWLTFPRFPGLVWFVDHATASIGVWRNSKLMGLW